jgi:RNA polymerase sigma-70 factor (ECF subfamily)
MTAVRARAAAAKRRAREEPIVDLTDSAVRPDTDLAAVIDEELGRLPEKYRIPIVLCDLGSKSHREAAQQLGWPQGTVSGRLFRGRQILAARLARRGVVASAVALAAVLAEGVSAARVSWSLTESTVTAAGLIAAGETAAGLSVEVAALTEGVVKTMLLTKLKVAASSLAVLLVCGAGTLGLRSIAADPPETKVDPPAAGRPAAEVITAPTEAERRKNAADLERLQGLWVMVDGLDNGEKTPAGELNNTCFVVRGDRISYFIQDGEKLGRLGGTFNQCSYGRITLDAAATPKRINMAMKSPVDRGTHSGFAIYKLDGDTFRLCTGDPERMKNIIEIRPRDFTSGRGSGKTLAIYKRSKETEQTKKQERLAKLRTKAWRVLEDLREDDDELAFPSPMEHQKWEREKLDEIGQVLKAMREPAK